MSNQTLVSAITSAVISLRHCEQGILPENATWAEIWSSRLDYLESNLLPHGSGFDAGTTIDRDKSNATKLVLHTSFHHMDDDGMYDGWTEHTVTITARLDHGFDAKVSGRNRNDIKDYIAEQCVWLLGLVGDWAEGNTWQEHKLAD